MDIREENDKRGVIVLGELPAVPICAAVANAVANAIGVRVPRIPMTPAHVLRKVEGCGGAIAAAARRNSGGVELAGDLSCQMH